MTAQEALNKALWSKLSSELRKSIIQSVDEEKLTVSYKNPNPEDTRILNKLGYHVMSNHDGLTYISWDLENSTDKIESKFKVGDWVVFIPSKSVYQIEKQGNYGYTLRNILGNSLDLSFFSKELIRKWTIQDAEDGDVVCYKDEVSLYKNKIEDYNKQETTFGGFTYYCCYDGKRFITNDFYLLTDQDEIDIYPATKKQCDILMKAMNNAGYEWDTGKKELKKKCKR